MAEQQFEIQRLYLKDASFEAPNTPELFLREWQPEVSIDLNVENKNIEGDIYEVSLLVTVTAKADEKTAFLVEVKQAAIFTIAGFDDEQRGHMLGAFCPNILYPYAREAVSDLVNRASLPQLLLAPINFDALYQQQRQGGGKQDA
ncbi:MAG: protein-export chaperone SecB [Gammaproteobacteria bacterium CG11_big_fil_rev_8_21_14_0_20_46_22]|nr:MAG: protein-export chaperone SecB [Gammaproteobacteria bacterium CG12_big_fil_rev_8_21_14_0_65_46_12]PIR10857.1 MAG: protein-export chaperone SecB [Gammaproteobacteria bacterium CG11_big_fil_rev_8_21_14_0_20_46_22]